MLGKAVQHVRENAVAWLALFVAMSGTAYAANTVGSADIIDESILSADIKNGEVKNADLINAVVTGPKLALNSVTSNRVVNGSLLGADNAPDTLTGAQINESTLGKVGDADTVDGLDSTQLQGQQGPPGSPGPPGPAGPTGPALFVDAQQGGDYTHVCTAANEWRECAKVTVTVPANKTYRVMIDSAGSYFAYASTNRVRICSSARISNIPFETIATTPASCVNQPTGISLDNEIKSSSTNGVRTLSGGASGASYIVGTAIRPDSALHWYNGYDFSVVHTMVTVAEVPPAAAGASGK